MFLIVITCIVIILKQSYGLDSPTNDDPYGSYPVIINGVQVELPKCEEYPPSSTPTYTSSVSFCQPNWPQ